MTDPNTPPLGAAHSAEKLERRRRTLILAQALLFLVWQVSFWLERTHRETLWTTGGFKISATVVWALLLCVVLATGGGWFRAGAARALLDNEITHDHRRSAYVWGYWSGILAVVALYLVTRFFPLTTMEIIHALLTVAVVVPLLRFAALEWSGDG